MEEEEMEEEKEVKSRYISTSGYFLHLQCDWILWTSCPV